MYARQLRKGYSEIEFVRSQNTYIQNASDTTWSDNPEIVS